MADLLFILFGFKCFAYDELKHFYLFGQVQTRQTGGHPYCDTSPYGECSLCNKRFHFQDIGLTMVPSTTTTLLAKTSTTKIL